ncbi:MAG: 23S ribosomal RNA methyltransferase Erm [Defluviitaleaceae bacterium]|nr:23S ribosomal RNA methyltransferase Erm [Defluviitaleaceae bacterium]
MSKKSCPPVWASQNFLTSTKIIRRLINKTTINPDDHVIEIGPGKGHITDALLRYCNKVSAVEIDKNLYEKLQYKYEATSKLKLFHQDFIRWNLPTTGAYKIFANIPFNHTTDIIMKLAHSVNPPSDAWLVIEKGAAKRFMGIPRENKTSLILKPQFDIEVIYYFSRDDFHPKPGVDVVMLHIKKKAICDIFKQQMLRYQRFISIATKNDGTGIARLFTKKQWTRARKIAGLNDQHSGEILYIQWLCLFRYYEKFSGK